MWRRICPSVVEFAWLNISEWEIRELSNVYTEGTLRTAISRLQPWEQTGLKCRYLDLLKFHEACFSPSAIWRDTASKSKGKLPPPWSKSTRHHILTSKSSLQECRLHWEKACLRCARSSSSLYVYKLGLGGIPVIPAAGVAEGGSKVQCHSQLQIGLQATQDCMRCCLKKIKYYKNIHV